MGKSRGKVAARSSLEEQEGPRGSLRVDDTGGRSKRPPCPPSREPSAAPTESKLEVPVDDLATNLTTTTTTNDQPGVSMLSGENVGRLRSIRRSLYKRESPNGSRRDKADVSIVSFCANAGLRATEMFLRVVTRGGSGKLNLAWVSHYRSKTVN